MVEVEEEAVEAEYNEWREYEEVEYSTSSAQQKRKVKAEIF